MSLARLSDISVSEAEEDTVATPVTATVNGTTTVTETDPVPPAATEPRLHEISGPAGPQFAGPDVCNARGKARETTTLSAEPLPWFATLAVKVAVPPTGVGSGECTRVMLRSVVPCPAMSCKVNCCDFVCVTPFTVAVARTRGVKVNGAGADWGMFTISVICDLPEGTNMADGLNEQEEFGGNVLASQARETGA